MGTGLCPLRVQTHALHMHLFFKTLMIAILTTASGAAITHLKDAFSKPGLGGSRE